MEITEELMNSLNDNSLYHTIGIRVESAGNGKARARLTPPAEICWPFAGQPHGGVLFTFMDTTMAWSVMSLLDSGYNCTTVNLNINYTHPAKGHNFICSASVTHKTGRSCFVSADIHDCNGQLLAMGQGTFRVIQMALNP